MDKHLLDEVRHVTIVAVATLPNGSYTGVSADLYARVSCPGSGHVFVETYPLSQLDLQASTRIAAIVASRVAGVDFRKCDFYLSIKADSPIVGGPSASGVATIAFAAALLGLPLNDSVVMTGMIMPDGSVGPVGGLKYKLDAAYLRGAKMFLVPYGQTVDYVYRVITRRIGGLIISQTVTERIDLIAYGKSLGIEVIPVANIYEALEIFTNGQYKARLRNESAILDIVRRQYEEIKSVLQAWIDNIVSEIENTTAVYNAKVGEVLDKVRIAYGSDTYRIVVSTLNNLDSDMKAAMDRARALEQNGSLYSAASQYFRALSAAYTRLYIVSALDDAKFLNTKAEEITASAIDLASSIRMAVVGRVDLMKLAIAVNILDRLYEALTYVNKSMSTNDLVSAASYLAYATARLYTAKLWSNLIDVQMGRGYEIAEENLKDMAVYIDTMARSLYTYIISLSQSVQLSDRVNDALHIYNIAQKADHALDRLTLCISALSYMYIALVDTFMQSPQITVEAINRTVYTNMLILGDLVPIDTILYLEFVRSLSSDYESQALTLSKLSMVLSIYSTLKLALSSAEAPTTTPSSTSSKGISEGLTTTTTTVVSTTTVTVYIGGGRAEPISVVIIALVAAIIIAVLVIMIAITRRLC